MIKSLSNSIVVIVMASLTVFQLNAQIDIKAEMADLLENPENYDSHKRVQIFNTYAAQYYSVSLDSVLNTFLRMEKFGREMQDSFVIAMALTSAGSTNKMKGKNMETFKALIAANPYLKSVPNELLKNLAAIATEATLLGKYDVALDYIEKAFQQHEVVMDSSNLVELHIVKGYYYEKQAQYYSALTEYQKALEYKAYATSPLKLCNIYQNISQMYNYLNDLDKAFEYLIPVEQIVKDNGYTLTANSLDFKRAAYYMKDLQFEEAEKHYLSALEYVKQKNIGYKILYAYANLAIINIEKGRLKEAKKYLNLAKIQVTPQISEAKRSAFYNAEYRYAQKVGDFSKSKVPLLKILALSEQTKDYNQAANAFEGLINLYENEGNWKQVAYYQKKLIESSKKHNKENQNILLYDLENKYQNEQKELSINNLESENQLKEHELSQKKKEIAFFAGLLILALAGLLALRYAYLSKQKMNKKLLLTNEKLSKALEVNNMLLKEIHHRVKNNLQVISSLLGLQQAYLTDTEAKNAIMTSKTRVQSMSLLHQKLYQGEDITKVNIKEYFENLILNLFQTYKVSQEKIELRQDIEPLVLDVDTVITMGLIFNELISNSLKYAFQKDTEGNINVSVKRIGNKINMVVSDNGKGVEFSKMPERSSSLGMNLVKSFTTKLAGEIEIDNSNGTHFEIAFPQFENVA